MWNFRSWGRRTSSRASQYRLGSTEALEIRTLPAATFSLVAQAYRQAIQDSAAALRAGNQEVAETKADLLALVNEGYTQNAQDLTNEAAEGDVEGILREVDQNKTLAATAKDINVECGKVLSNLAKIHRDLVREVGKIYANAARRKITNQVACDQIQAAVDLANERYAQVDTTGEESATIAFTELADLLAQFDNSADSVQPVAFQGDVAGTVEVDALTINAPIAGTMNVSSFRPVEGAVVVVSINITEVTLDGDPDVKITSAVGTVVAKYHENGTLEPISGTMIVSGTNQGVPFALPASTNSNTPLNITIDNGQITGITGQFTIPAIPGLLDAPATATFNLAPNP